MERKRGWAIPSAWVSRSVESSCVHLGARLRSRGSRAASGNTWAKGYWSNSNGWGLFITRNQSRPWLWWSGVTLRAPRRGGRLIHRDGSCACPAMDLHREAPVIDVPVLAKPGPPSMRVAKTVALALLMWAAAFPGHAKCAFTRYVVEGRVLLPQGISADHVRIYLFIDGMIRASDYPGSAAKPDFGVLGTDGTFRVESWV